MIKTKLRPVVPYTGMPVLATAFLLLSAGVLDPFIVLRFELLIVFGYIAAAIDLRTRRIPNSLVLLMLASWILVMIPRLFYDTDMAVALFVDSAVGFAIGGVIFLLVYFISRKGLGGGDVKFMAVVGLYLGSAGILPAMLCGTVLAALTALMLILLKRISKKDAIPLSPFLYAGILVTVFLL